MDRLATSLPLRFTRGSALGSPLVARPLGAPLRRARRRGHLRPAAATRGPSQVWNNVAWMFQRVARRVGKPAMRDWLGRLEYGNRDMAGGIDQFWLQGGLRTTAMEQVAFLHRLAEGRLAATQRSQRLVRESLRVEKARTHTLHAKAGTVARGPNAVSWWVGWVERRDRVDAVFAANLSPGTATPYADRFVISRAILSAEGALPPLP